MILSKVTCLCFSTLPDSSQSLKITVLSTGSCTHLVFVHISVPIINIKCSFTFYYFLEIHVSQEDSCILFIFIHITLTEKKFPKTANKANFPGVFLLFIGKIITSINIKYYLFMPLSSKISETKMFLNA